MAGHERRSGAILRLRGTKQPGLTLSEAASGMEAIDPEVADLIREEFPELPKRHLLTLQLLTMGFRASEIAVFFGTYRNDIYRVIRAIRGAYCRNTQ